MISAIPKRSCASTFISWNGLFISSRIPANTSPAHASIIGPAILFIFSNGNPILRFVLITIRLSPFCLCLSKICVICSITNSLSSLYDSDSTGTLKFISSYFIFYLFWCSNTVLIIVLNNTFYWIILYNITMYSSLQQAYTLLYTFLKGGHTL